MVKWQKVDKMCFSGIISTLCFADVIQSIDLPTGSWANNNFVNSNVAASGFGATSDSK